jgi:alkylhydroperoxidase family enzyme
MPTKLEKEISRKIGPYGRIRLSKPRIPPVNDEEFIKKAEKFVDESEWAKEAQFVINYLRNLSAQQRRINVFKTWMEYPESFMRNLMWGFHILGQSTLPGRDRELLILRIGWLCGAEYEWSQHKMIGSMSGLKTKEIRRITKGPDAEGWDPFDATLIRAVDELYTDCFISEATWNTLAERYDKRQLIDLIFTIGTYNSICMFLNTLGVQLDEGFSGFPKEKE